MNRIAASSCMAAFIGLSACYVPITDIVVHEDGRKPDAGTLSCAGNRVNCERRYDQVTFLATHNAFSYATGGSVHYKVPNQPFPISRQLKDGVRALGIRPSRYYGSSESEKKKVYVTHNTDLQGFLGQEPLADVLGEVRVFLESQPNEVITLFAESEVSPADLTASFDMAGLTSYVHVHERGSEWPTLAAMIRKGERLVVFNDSHDPARPAWQHYMWDFIVDTDYNVTDVSQFSCEYHRGKPENELYFINEFIYRELGPGVLVPDAAMSSQANDESFVYARATSCWREKKRIPNFIYVDWYIVGGVRAAVDSLNDLLRDTFPSAASVDAPPG